MSATTITELIDALQASPSGADNLTNSPLIPENQMILKFPNDPRAIITSRQVVSGPDTIPLDYEASGVIVDTRDWSVIAKPPANVAQYATEHVKHSAAYADLRGEVYPVRDGTTITLYYHGGSWAMGTRRSLNMFSNVWIGHKKYSEIFKECLDHSLASKPRSLGAYLGTLDRDWSYTVGFAHPEHHPAESKPSVWLISCYSRVQRVFKSGKALTLQDSPCTGLPLYLPTEETPEDAFREHAKRESADPNYCGFIVRPGPEDAPGCPIMCRSKRLIARERLLYGVIRGVDSRLKIKYAILMSLRDPNTALEFAQTFPGLAGTIKHVKGILMGISMEICHRMVMREPDDEGFAAEFAKKLITDKQLTSTPRLLSSIVGDLLLAHIDKQWVLSHILGCLA